MKTASQANWSLTYIESPSGFKFITLRSMDSKKLYCEFHVDVATDMIVPGKSNDIAFFDLPLSVCQLIRFWFGRITAEQYIQALVNIREI